MKAQLPDWGACLFDLSLRYIAIHGGRGSAKSRTIATALILQAAQKPYRILCAREIQRSLADSSKRILDDEINRLGLQGFFTSTDSEIRGMNGSLIIFAGLRLNVNSLKSMEGIDIVWVDEAQSISDNSLSVLIPTIRKPGSRLIFSWNPRDKNDPIDKLFRGHSVPDRSHVVQVNFDQNPWFPEELRAEMEYDKQRDPDKYLHVWMGEYIQRSEAKIFKKWKVEEFDSPENGIYYYGADWGFAKDPTVLVRCRKVGNTLYIDYEAHGVGVDIKDTPALFATVPGAMKSRITADSARPETISHMRKGGWDVVHAIKGKGSIEDGITWLQSHDIIIHPRCKLTIDQFMKYSYKTDPLTGQVQKHPEDKNNDVHDALRYATEAARKAPQPQPQVKVVPVASHWHQMNRR